jgi:hypothetical protein
LDEGIGNTLVLVGTRFLVYRRIASLLYRIEGNGSAAWLNCPIWGRITKVPVTAQFSPEDGEMQRLGTVWCGNLSTLRATWLRGWT